MSNMERKMEKADSGLNNHKKRLNALERLDALENQFGALNEELSKYLTQLQAGLNKRLELIENALNAAIIEIGVEKVQITAQRLHKEKLEVELQKNTKDVEDAVTAGKFTVGDTVTENSLVVGSEKDKDGVQKLPTKMFLSFGQFTDEVKAKIKDKIIGDVVDLTDGGTFEVLEVYNPIIPTEYVSPETTQPSN
jgi:hypothetical protein